MRSKSPRRAEQNGKTCATCEFWRPLREGVGACRRYPPTVLPTGSQSPETAAEFWCGEWDALKLSTL